MPHIPYYVNETFQISAMYALFLPVYDNTYEFKGETHDFWESMYVIDGSVCVSSDDKVYNMEAGEIIFHPAMAMHKFNITSPVASFLIFSCKIKGDKLDYFRNNRVFRLTNHQKNIINDMINYFQSVEPNKYVNPAILSPKEYHQYLMPFNTVPGYSQMITTYIYQLMHSLLHSDTSVLSSTSHESVIFSNIVKYLNANISINLSVYDIANAANLSVSTIKRIFQKYAGIGVHKYMLNVKLTEATRLLKAGISVADVAYNLGFSSPSYFSKVYKRELRRSPSSVKK